MPLSLLLAVAVAAPLRMDATPSALVLGDEATRAALTITSATTPRLHLVVLQDRARADRIERVTVVVLATEEDGRLLRGGRLRLLPARGQASLPEQRAPGEYRAQWTLQPGRTGTVRIEARISESDAPPVAAQIALDPGPAAVIDLGADRQAVAAGSGAEVVLRAHARDSMGNATSEPLELAGLDGLGTL